MNVNETGPTCCGQPMTHTDYLPVRVWECVHRPGHPEVYENLKTGERIGETS